ncbi:MAG: DUF6624 domain-containing protein [Bacteroidota bacterium]
MKKSTVIFLAMVMIISVVSTEAGAQKNKESVKLPAISEEIMSMRDADQKMRIKWSTLYKKQKSETPKFKELTQKLIASDRANTARMREIVQEHGWPTYDLVGRRASNGAWLIVQHSDRNPLFQAKCLPLLKAAVDNGQADPSNYAYLYDRVQVSQAKKQLYATQSRSNNGLMEGTFYAINDESNVQNRREEMGIDYHVEEYAKSMGFEYQVPSAEEAKKRSEKIVAEYEKNVAEAQQAMKAKDYKAAADKYLLVTIADGAVTTDDLVLASKALSLSNHEQMKEATSFLTKAMARGWDGLDEIKTHSDFENLRNSNSPSWQDFIITAEQMALDR